MIGPSVLVTGLSFFNESGSDCAVNYEDKELLELIASAEALFDKKEILQLLLEPTYSFQNSRPFAGLLRVSFLFSQLCTDQVCLRISGDLNEDECSMVVKIHKRLTSFLVRTFFFLLVDPWLSIPK